MSEPTRPPLSDQWRRLPWIARIGLVAAAVVIGAAAFAQVRDTTPDRPSARTAPQASEPPAAQPVLAGQIGSGVWLVGADVQPGTYRSSGPDEADGYCMWSRHDSTAGGPLDGIIASDGTFDAGQMVVTIEAGDALFRTNGCAPFALVG